MVITGQKSLLYFTFHAPRYLLFSLDIFSLSPEEVYIRQYSLDEGSGKGVTPTILEQLPFYRFYHLHLQTPSDIKTDISAIMSYKEINRIQEEWPTPDFLKVGSESCE